MKGRNSNIGKPAAIKKHMSAMQCSAPQSIKAGTAIIGAYSLPRLYWSTAAYINTPQIIALIKTIMGGTASFAKINV